MVLEGCLDLVIFPDSQAPQRWSLRNLTDSMPMTCFFFASVCKFLMPAWPGLRCHNHPSEVFASKQVAGWGPVEKSTMYKSPLLTPSKTLDLSDYMMTTHLYLPKITIISRSQSIETDMRLKPRDSTSITLSICLSLEIATLPSPNTLLLPLSAYVICFRGDGVSGIFISKLLSPVMWCVEPLSRTHSVLLGLSSSKWISIAYHLICFRLEEYDINFIR